MLCSTLCAKAGLPISCCRKTAGRDLFPPDTHIRFGKNLGDNIMPDITNNNSHNANNANTGFSAAEQRVLDRDRMARRFTDMSNGVFGNNSPPAQPPPLSLPPSAPPREAPPAAPDTGPQPETVPQRQNKSLIPGLLENADPEKLLLAALMLLLVSEGADFVLIAALIYVMM